MDHIENAIRQFYDVYLDNFMDYQKEGNYKKLTDNPMYGELKAIVDSMNCIRKQLGWETIKLSEEVKYYD